MVELFLLSVLGFVGSFGHCAGMCGPLVVAFAVTDPPRTPSQQWQFQLLLNGGRILSYALTGAVIGGVGSVLAAGGQMAGIASPLRQGLTLLTGGILVWMGLTRIYPQSLPSVPFLHPMMSAEWHQRLSRSMVRLSLDPHVWTPLLLGLVWGFIPCGFLYTAQIKAASAGSFGGGLITMLAFGLGTVPSMVGVGISTGLISASRRSQLFQMGGWLTLGIGGLMMVRTDAMVDWTGHMALGLLMLALVARPLKPWIPTLLRYRRTIGVSSFVLALAHTGHMLVHTLGWNLGSIGFFYPRYQLGFWAGVVSLALMAPAALTSTDSMVKGLGVAWRRIHLLIIPALVLATVHTVLTGSHYWGNLTILPDQQWRVGVILLLTLGVLGIRLRIPWVPPQPDPSTTHTNAEGSNPTPRIPST